MKLSSDWPHILNSMWTLAGPHGYAGELKVPICTDQT